MPASRSSSCSDAQTSCWRAIRVEACSRMAASCSAGVMPSSLSIEARVGSMSTRPATRTM